MPWAVAGPNCVSNATAAHTSQAAHSSEAVHRSRTLEGYKFASHTAAGNTDPQTSSTQPTSSTRQQRTQLHPGAERACRCRLHAATVASCHHTALTLQCKIASLFAVPICLHSTMLSPFVFQQRCHSGMCVKQASTANDRVGGESHRLLSLLGFLSFAHHAITPLLSL